MISDHPGLAKRLSACDLTELSPEDVAKAAQSLVALRQAPNKLMEATEQVLRWMEMCGRDMYIY